MNIYQKLIEVRKEVPYIQKADQGRQYNYTGSSRVLGSLKSKMDELGLLLIPKVTGSRVHMETVEYQDPKTNLPKKTTTYFTELDMEFTWVNAENPDEQIVCPWYGQGIDIAGEKGVGKCMTYSEKYFMLKFFNIATDKDDPDSFQQKFEDKQEPTKKQELPKQEPDKSKILVVLSKWEALGGTKESFATWLMENKQTHIEDLTPGDIDAMEQSLTKKIMEKKGKSA